MKIKRLNRVDYSLLKLSRELIISMELMTMNSEVDKNPYRLLLMPLFLLLFLVLRMPFIIMLLGFVLSVFLRCMLLLLLLLLLLLSLMLLPRGIRNIPWISSGKVIFHCLRLLRLLLLLLLLLLLSLSPPLCAAAAAADGFGKGIVDSFALCVGHRRRRNVFVGVHRVDDGGGAQDLVGSRLLHGGQRETEIA